MILTKKISVVLFFFFSLMPLFSQNKTTKIIYGVSVSEQDNFKDQWDLIKDKINFLSFSLISNESEYSFTSDEIMDDANKELKMLKILCGYTASTYYDKKTDFLYLSYNDVLGSYVLKKEKKNFDWKITTETKQIDGFVCYKATTSDTVINPSGTYVYPIVVWFTPSIPLSIGPLGVGGLPGAILELQRKNITYGVKSIIFESDEKIKKPSLKKVITVNELQKMREDFLNDK